VFSLVIKQVDSTPSWIDRFRHRVWTHVRVSVVYEYQYSSVDG